MVNLLVRKETARLLKMKVSSVIVRQVFKMVSKYSIVVNLWSQERRFAH
jgi:hypothetical protein